MNADNNSQSDNEPDFNNRVPEEEFNLQDLNLNISLRSSLSNNKQNQQLISLQ